jgi:N-acetylmuramoyl-L-alanine amidase
MKVIDPGHGGIDPGASGVCGVPEKDVNLAVAKLVAAKLSPVEVKLTRETDLAVDLHARGPMANDWGAELFVSIHCNSVSDPNANGIETYHYPDDEEGKRLAQEVHSRLVSAYGLRDRGIKTAEFAVLKETKAPAILVEMAFLSNPVECAILTSGVGQEQAAAAIADGIRAYRGDYSAQIGTRTVEAKMIGDVLWVPLRATVEAMNELNRGVEWNGKTKTATVQ